MKKKSISVVLMGGLGNQMFQYAFAEALAYKRSTEIILDCRYLNSRCWRPNFTYRRFDLDVFDHSFKLVDKPNYLPGEFYFRMIKWRIYKQISVKFGFKKSKTVVEDSFFYDDNLLARTGEEYVGYFQSYRYFDLVKDKVKNTFIVKKSDLLLDSRYRMEILNCNSVCLNVRRTDFVDSILGVPDILFYKTAVKMIIQRITNPRFFIFSDDIEWCIRNLGFIKNATIVSHNYAGRKFSNYFNLMCCCKHFIIPNSSFAWWAAYLSNSDNKKVIVPRGWHKYLGVNGDKDIVPDDWDKVECSWTV